MAAAAYRAGAMLKDERSGRIHRYEKRTGVRSAFILAPNTAPEKLLTRAVLWNAAEASENRKNSRVAREVILALPHELSDQQRQALAREMALYLIERYRVAVDVAVHSPCEGDGHDPRNHHAHLLFTTREVTKEGLGVKTRILDDKVTGPQEIEIIREVWETLANDVLKRAGFADIQIDRRSLEDQGIDRIPQTHEGKASKNAAKNSELAQAFASSRQGEKEDGAKDQTKDGGDEEDGSGEKTSSSGGGSAQTLKSKVREDRTGRTIDYPKLDKQQTRSAFNAEIKALNERRAAFGDKPLKEQIKQLDRLMERLDRRVEKLQALETKTSLKSAIKDTIKAAVKLAAALVTRREQTKAVRAFTAQEKHARTERHIARYGRSYRDGLHSQIKDMKQNMAIVEAKKEDFRRYKSFVDSIDREISKHPSIALDKEQTPQRRVTDKEINLKLHLKAEMIRSNIPAEFRAPSPMKGERQTLTNSTAVNKILQTKTEPIRIDRTALSKPETPAPTPTITRPPAPPVRAAFTNRVQVQPTPKAQAEYKQPMPVRIKALEQAIAQRQATRTEAPRPEDRKSWFTPANEKTRPLQRSIEAAMRQQRQEAPQVRNTTETQSRFSRAQERPQKTATYSEVREKVRTEAETKRSRVPPEYRAEPYDRPREEPRQARSAEEKPRTATSSTFSRATEAPNQPKPERPRMSDTFNMKSGAQDTEQAPPRRNPDDKPEAEI
ncbi:MAG: MobA/MobL family protein [Rhodospirillales bacterium]|nr:MobA/MobL family protein [Rhodospirillales bacterium]